MREQDVVVDLACVTLASRRTVGEPDMADAVDVARQSGRQLAFHEVQVHSRLRSNNASVLPAAARSGHGVTILPRYLAHEPPRKGDVVEVLAEYSLPTQDMRAVYPWPRQVS